MTITELTNEIAHLIAAHEAKTHTEITSLWIEHRVVQGGALVRVTAVVKEPVKVA